MNMLQFNDRHSLVVKECAVQGERGNLRKSKTDISFSLDVFRVFRRFTAPCVPRSGVGRVGRVSAVHPLARDWGVVHLRCVFECHQAETQDHIHGMKCGQTPGLPSEMETMCERLSTDFGPTEFALDQS